jgi:hypothetical protein
MRRSLSARISGCRMASRRFLAAGIGEDDGAHRGAVERAVGGRDAVAESGADRRHGGAAGRGQLMGDGVGVDHRDAVRGEQVAGGALAAADAAGEADYIAHDGQSPMVASA